MTKKKIRVLVLYGGRSVEHEISCRSASFVLRNLDPKKYEISVVAIDKEGLWLPQNTQDLLQETNAPLPIASVKSIADCQSLPTSPSDSMEALAPLRLKGSAEVDADEDLVVFPVLHGTFGEDGTLQGLMDFAEVAYVGADTLGSAVGMDKGLAKRLVEARGIPVVPYVEAREEHWQKQKSDILSRIAGELKFPVFVKPPRLGSSVGIEKIDSQDKLEQAIGNAFTYDDKVLVETGINAREIECAVLGGYDPEVSIPGEIVPNADFYTYKAKYLDENGAKLLIPADLSDQDKTKAREICKMAFEALELYGMARVDLFLCRDTGQFFFNEVNTIPGLTEISLYPQLWAHSGVSASELCDRLISLALNRRDQKAKLKRNRS